MNDQPTAAPPANVTWDLGFLWRVCLVAALGGLLFGYDWVVVGGARPLGAVPRGHRAGALLTS